MGFFSWIFGSAKAPEPVVKKVYPGPPEYIEISQNSQMIIMALAGVVRDRLVLKPSGDQGLLDKLMVKINEVLSDEEFAQSILGVDLKKYAEEHGVNVQLAYKPLLEEYDKTNPGEGAKFRLYLSNAHNMKRIASDNIYEMKKALTQIEVAGKLERFQNKLNGVMRQIVFIMGLLMEDQLFSGIYEHELKEHFGPVVGKLLELEASVGRDEEVIISQHRTEYGELAANDSRFQNWLQRRINQDGGKSLYAKAWDNFNADPMREIKRSR